jgi:REP element-mobilizing transposase RayT
MSDPLAYLITWTCYGTWLHGDERGSVDRHGRNSYGHPLVAANGTLRSATAARLPRTPFALTAEFRTAVLAAIRGVAAHRGWVLYAVHVRSNHVHVVVGGTAAPERMLNEFKVYASRGLNAIDSELHDRPKWTRHGSTKYLWKSGELEAAIHSVAEEQGEPMAVWCSSEARMPHSG